MPFSHLNLPPVISGPFQDQLLPLDLWRVKRQAINATSRNDMLNDLLAIDCQCNAELSVSVWTTRAASEMGQRSESIDAKWLCNTQSHSLHQLFSFA